ncbi:hypothetical protein [Burkholderia stagnalis]|uniref:hypothetical protein n=1 Tax=Burkholderia stagnalis TaxID=1503054 RepID=UPI0012D9E9F7|nr:hypothetical protein [Burkholderia stagnalis]
MENLKSLTSGNWHVADCVFRSAGRLGMTVEQIANAAKVTVDTAKGRVRNLIGLGYLKRVGTERPAAYRCYVRELPAPVETKHERQLRLAEEAMRTQADAIAHTAAMVDRMCRCGVTR